MNNFTPFGLAVFNRFNKLSAHELFVVGEDNREFEKVYLAAFPAGTDPVFKTRTEHDCSCCKNFLRNIGNVIAIVDGKVQTVWDIEGLEHPYNVVAQQMHEFVLSLPITDLFRPAETKYGNEKTHSLYEGRAKTWNHFYAKVKSTHICPNPATVAGEYRTNVQTFKRGLEELSLLALETVGDLISSNSIYRGAEFANGVRNFITLHKKYQTLSNQEKEIYLWANAKQGAYFKNSVIGTLVSDISEGKDVDEAVRMYEAKVAPANYKRPTAVVTPAMIKQAVKTIADMGWEPSLERRLANIRDVSVNNVLWVDNSVKGKMKGGLESLLMKSVVQPTTPTKDAEDVSIDDFMQILPRARGIDMMFKNHHVGNLMTLTAPVHPDAPKLFQWNNGFAWSYNGNITDSIKDKVKKAGGNVNAKLRMSLSWFNYDDLDIHVKPAIGPEIYFRDKQGKLDVDMNAGSGQSREAVENVSLTSVPDGVYKILVNQFCRRETSNVGFVIEVECQGEIKQYKYSRAVTGMTPVVDLTTKNGQIVHVAMHSGVVEASASQTKWSLSTETFVKVNTVMHSPNYWDDNAVGNKHWFFVVDGCKADEAARGIYNEFLSGEASKHRKVFELIGEKTKCEPVDDQLSGLGFSSTKQDSIVVRVSFENGQKLYRVQF